MAVSSEKIALLTTLAEEFNESDAEVDGECIFVRPRSVSSGRAADLIPQGWPNPDVNGEAAGDLVAGRLRLGRHRQRARRGRRWRRPARRSCSRRW